ncbi:MAG TPA: hypothetical protein VIY48_02080 [Candidatus Paceibacterota bacterium]
MPITTETFEGTPGGMNLALPAQEIEDVECEYAQDILFDKPGLIRRRGPVLAAAGFATTPTPATGLVHTLDPNGNSRLLALYGDTVNGYAGLYSSDYTTIYAYPWNGAFPTAPPTNPYRIVDSKAALTGGTWIGTSSTYNSNGPVQSLALWRGGNKADYSTGTVTITRGSTTLTGAGTTWTNNVVPGMFLFLTTDDGYTLTYAGVVKSVDSATQVTMAAPAPYPATAKAYKFSSLRGFAPRVLKGRVTCATGSTTVTGANTKFISQHVNTGTWNLYRASDFAWIGKVSVVNNDTSITLAANAAVALNNERFIALRADADWNISTMSVADAKVGFLNATYSERNWYANLGQAFDLTSRVYFSDTSDPEGVDMAAFDGDYINVASSVGVNSPIKAMTAAYNALVVFKENETFGIFGTTPSTFSVKKIEDDGTLSGMSVQPYGGGVLWAGREGVHYFDGIQPQNITAGKLGNYYKNLMRTFDPSKYRMWSMMARDHYYLFLEKCTPSVNIVKGVVNSQPTTMTIVINMVSRAVSMFTNVHIRGAVIMPADTGYETLFLANTSTAGTICTTTDLYDTDGINDGIVCDGGAAGPDLYFVSKKFNAGDSLRLKLFKQLAINYLAQGDNLKVDTVVGLNEVGKTSLTMFTATVPTWDSTGLAYSNWDTLGVGISTWDNMILAVYKPKRVKFLKRSTNLSFRIWQNSPSVTRVLLGPFSVGYKLMRPGRV